MFCNSILLEHKGLYDAAHGFTVRISELRKVILDTDNLYKVP